jgi:cobalt-zinc-cadmium efflux system outer membrane protein
MFNTGLTWRSTVGLLSGWLVVAGLAGGAACDEGKEPATARSQVTLERRGAELKGVITLGQALTAALRNNPDLDAVSAEIKAQEARAVQAGLLPNPELGVEVENFGGSGDVSGFEATETTVQLSQRFELGEKRAKRKQVASLGRDVAQSAYESGRADVFTAVQKAFVGVLSAQGRVSLAGELVTIAEQVFRTVSERVKAGKVSPIEETGARIGLASSRVKLAQARLGLEAARKTLSLTWGSETADFERAEGRLDALLILPGLDRLVPLVAKNPDFARLEKEIEARRANLFLENAKRIPDLTVSGGARRLNESDDTAFVMGFSVPLPLFDRNQGGVEEARHKLDKAKRALEAARRNTVSSLTERYGVLSSAFEEAESLKTRIIPDAMAAFKGTREGYQLGKFGYLFMLDAQRVLFDAEIQHLDALTTYHQALADIERLTGSQVISYGVKP